MAEVGLVIRFTIGFLLIAAAAAKLRDLDAFRHGLAGYGFRGTGAAMIAIGIPAVEAFLGVCLVGGRLTRPAAGAAALLFAGFTVIQLRAYARGGGVPCHCFGEAPFETVSAITVTRSALLLGLSLATLLVGPEWNPGDGSTLLALLPIAGGAFVVLRSLTVLPIVAAAARTQPYLAATPTSGGRVSFRDQRLDVSLVPRRGD